MKFESKLIKASLIKRYKRFLADVCLENGEIVVAHCPNTGSMKTCGEPGDTVYLSSHDDPKRKLKYTWELTQCKTGLIGINTHRPNHIVEEALKKQRIDALKDYTNIKREVKYQDSRFDFKLTDASHSKTCWLEVKNVTLLEKDKLYFPDAVSTRALKHLKTLETIAKKGERAIIFYLVNRTEEGVFHTADHIHPDYGKTLIKVVQSGVEVLVYQNKISTNEITLHHSLPYLKN